MNVYKWFLSAGRRAWQCYKAEPVVFTAPLFLSGAIDRAVTFLLKHSLGGKHLLLDLGVLLLFSFPLSLVAGVVCARLYLRQRDGLPWSGDDLLKLVRSREVLLLLGRLLPLIAVWLLLAMIPAALIAFLPRIWRAFVFGLQHPGVKPAPVVPHSSLIFTSLYLFTVCAVLSRYTFVVPLFATGRFSAKQAMRSGVKLAQGTLLALSVLALVSASLSFGFGRPMRRLETGLWGKRFVVGLAVLLESSVVYSLAAVIGAELAYSKWELGTSVETVESPRGD